MTPRRHVYETNRLTKSVTAARILVVGEAAALLPGPSSCSHLRQHMHSCRVAGVVFAAVGIDRRAFEARRP